MQVSVHIGVVELAVIQAFVVQAFGVQLDVAFVVGWQKSRRSRLIAFSWPSALVVQAQEPYLQAGMPESLHA